MVLLFTVWSIKCRGPLSSYTHCADDGVLLAPSVAPQKGPEKNAASVTPPPPCDNCPLCMQEHEHNSLYCSSLFHEPRGNSRIIFHHLVFFIPEWYFGKEILRRVYYGFKVYGAFLESTYFFLVRQDSIFDILIPRDYVSGRNMPSFSSVQRS